MLMIETIVVIQGLFTTLVDSPLQFTLAKSSHMTMLYNLIYT